MRPPASAIARLALALSISTLSTHCSFEVADCQGDDGAGIRARKQVAAEKGTALEQREVPRSGAQLNFGLLDLREIAGDRTIWLSRRATRVAAPTTGPLIAAISEEQAGL
jgi:hypothetical protein